MSQAAAPRTFVVGKTGVATAEERAALEKLGVGGAELRAVYLLDNRRTSGDGPVEGAVYDFSPDAKIREGSPFVVCSNRLFGHILVAQVLDDAVDEGASRKKLQTLAETIRTRSDKPYSLVQCMTAHKVHDAAAWNCELGSHGHFVGLYKEENDRALANYYLVVHTDSGNVGQELVEKFIAPRLGQLTYGALFKSDEYKRAALYSRRNAQRLLAIVAQTLGLRILKEDDLWAHLDTARFQAPPDLGVPNVSATEYNILSSVPRGSRGESIVFYSRAANLASIAGNAAAFLVDPCYGVVLYRGDLNRNRNLTGLWSNTACSGFPIGTGRLQSADDNIQANRRRTGRDRQLQAFVNMILSWQGRAADTPASTHDRIYSYAGFSAEKQTIHTEQLGATHGSTRLKPVLIVIPPPGAAGQ